MSRVVVFGNATVDLVQRVERLPRPGETLLSKSLSRCPGGKGLNQAVAAARTGARVLFVAPVGGDADSRFLRDYVAAEEGLETEWIASGARTDLSVILAADDGENVIVTNAPSAAAVSPEAATRLKGLDRADFLLMQGNLPAATTAAALEIARARGARSIVNLAPVADACRAALGLATILIANAGEAEQLAGGTGSDSARKLVRGHSEWAIVTRGAEDVAVFGPPGLTVLPVPRVEVIDTAGAGDVFAGTFAGLLALGEPVLAAIGISLRAASLSVTREGTTPSFPTRHEVAALRAGNA
jgi:ribokinase